MAISGGPQSFSKYELDKHVGIWYTIILYLRYINMHNIVLCYGNNDDKDIISSTVQY